MEKIINPSGQKTFRFVFFSCPNDGFFFFLVRKKNSDGKKMIPWFHEHTVKRMNERTNERSVKLIGKKCIIIKRNENEKFSVSFLAIFKIDFGKKMSVDFPITSIN